jgi:DNA-binding transcriptional LysR family regulator
MTLEQLRIFVAVAERLHMTRAAAALHITQSAASAAVAALEARYGARLFDRVGRGLVLSETGRMFLPEAKAVLGRAETARRTLDDLAGLRKGIVTLFASQTLASYWLPPRMARFAQAYPRIELRLSIGNTAQVARAVTEGEAELGFIEGPVDDPALAHARVGSDRLALVAAPAHPLAMAEAITAVELASVSWALREPGSGTRAELEQALRQLGLDPAALKVVLVFPSNEAIMAAVSSGDLVAAVSELAVKSMVEIGRLRQLPFAFAERPFELLTHRERRRSRAAASFIEWL